MDMDKMDTKEVPWRCRVKKWVLKISQNSLDKTCVGASFSIKSHAADLQLY